MFDDKQKSDEYARSFDPQPGDELTARAVIGFALFLAGVGIGFFLSPTAEVLMHHLLPILFAFTLVNLDDALFRGLKEAMRALEPAADDEALTILAASAARGKNEYVKRTAPSGTPHQITATDASGKDHDYIFIAEIADGNLGHSIEALDTPGQPISRED